MASPSPTRVGYFERLRLLAMLGVILIHGSALYLEELAAGGQALGAAWHLANLLDSFSRFSVPVFLMITGALLLPREDSLSLSVIGRRRIPRVAVPLLFWSAVYILLQTAMVKDYRPLEAVKNLLSTPAEDHLWYLYALIAVYLLLPLLRLLVKHAPRRIILYTLLLWAVFSSLWRAAAGLLPALQLPSYANLDILGGYAGYVLLGHVLHTAKKTPSAAVSGGVFAVCSLFTAAATWVMTLRAGELNGVFYQYFMPNVAVMAAAAFLLLRRLGEKRREAGHAVTALSSLSFGVYLIHEAFIRLFHLAFSSLPPLAALPLTILTTAAASLLCALVLIRLPVVRFLAMGESARQK